MNYWVDAQARAITARRHTREMASKYPNEIQACVDATQEYTEMYCFKEADTSLFGKSSLTDIDSVSAVFLATQTLPDQKIAVVNFSSFTDPGGMFLKGSKAQEECLCHESILFNILSSQKLAPFYQNNKKDKNRGLYYNRALFSPNVLFIRQEQICQASVITCAAPNLNYALKYGGMTRQQADTLSYDVMLSRIRFIRDIALEHNISTLIFGAYGCGVFKNNPYTVAQLSKQIFEPSGLNVCYAVLDKTSYNYQAFASIFA